MGEKGGGVSREGETRKNRETSKKGHAQERGLLLLRQGGKRLEAGGKGRLERGGGV